MTQSMTWAITQETAWILHEMFRVNADDHIDGRISKVTNEYRAVDAVGARPL